MYKRIPWVCAAAVMFWAGMSIGQEKKAVTADRHIQQHSISCTGCHGNDQPKAVTQQACLTCHKSLEEVAERTKKFNYNPHQNHLTRGQTVECLQCHQGHKEDILACSQCHEGIKFEKKQNSV